MKYNIPDRVYRDLTRFAKDNSIEKIVLFGSRARGQHSERSDIDLAVTGGDVDSFYWDVMEKAHTLLMFDIVELDKNNSDEFLSEILKDGITIYEKN